MISPLTLTIIPSACNAFLQWPRGACNPRPRTSAPAPTDWEPSWRPRHQQGFEHDSCSNQDVDFNGFQSANCESEKIRIRFWAICSHPTLNTNMIREDLTRSHPRSPQETFFFMQRRPFGKNREAGLVYNLYIANLRYPAQKKIFAG